MPALRNRRRVTPRQEEIRRAGRKARNRFQRLPGGGLPRNGPMPKGGQGPARGGRLGAAAIPGLGPQLTRRVQSGAITREQAQRTAKQRQTLKVAYGEDWRTKVFGDRGYAQRTRTALAKNPDSERLKALNTSLLSRRAQMLKAARARLAEGGESGAPRRRRRRA